MMLRALVVSGIVSAGIMLAGIAGSSLASAQPSGSEAPPPAASAPPPPPAAPYAADDGAAGPGTRQATVKQAACRDQARQQGLRGPDLRDQVVICVAEARLACLKAAVAGKVRGSARRTYIDDCMAKP